MCARMEMELPVMMNARARRKPNIPPSRTAARSVMPLLLVASYQLLPHPLVRARALPAQALGEMWEGAVEAPPMIRA